MASTGSARTEELVQHCPNSALLKKSASAQAAHRTLTYCPYFILYENDKRALSRCPIKENKTIMAKPAKENKDEPLGKAALESRRQAAQEHRRCRIQACGDGADLPEIHLRFLRRNVCQTASRRRRVQPVPTPKTRTNTKRRTFSLCQQKRAGRTLLPKPNYPPSVLLSMRRWMPSKRKIPRSRACCPRCSRGKTSTPPAWAG